MSLSEAPNGAVLLKAFCGCEPASVLAACDLSLADLFPRRLESMTPAQRNQARRDACTAAWAAALRVLAREATVVLVAARHYTRGETLTGDDLDRLALAVDRIQSARAVLA